MPEELTLLLVTAATIGVLHTLVGPDHFVPFIALARARGWSLRRTLGITVVCGVGHVLGSVLLGVVGIAAGLSLQGLEAVESGRGDLAAWALITAGLLYAVWGLRRAGRRHGHDHGHAHDHGRDGAIAATTTGWVLFIIFILGPCEALIPVLMYPAATLGVAEVGLVTAVFGLSTLATMVAAVSLGVAGIRLVPLGFLARYAHTLAGATIALCGIGIVYLGL